MYRIVFIDMDFSRAFSFVLSSSLLSMSLLVPCMHRSPLFVQIPVKQVIRCSAHKLCDEL